MSIPALLPNILCFSIGATLIFQSLSLGSAELLVPDSNICTLVSTSCLKVLHTHVEPFSGVGSYMKEWLRGFAIADTLGIKYLPSEFSPGHVKSGSLYVSPAEYSTFFGLTSLNFRHICKNESMEAFFSSPTAHGNVRICSEYISCIVAVHLEVFLEQKDHREFLSAIVERAPCGSFFIVPNQVRWSPRNMEDWLRDRFWSVHALPNYEKEIRIGVHLRRGDALSNPKHHNRLTSEVRQTESLETIVRVLSSALNATAANFSVHIHSEGKVSDFPLLLAWSRRTDIPIRFFVHETVITSLLNMASLHILVGATSQFSELGHSLSFDQIIFRYSEQPVSYGDVRKRLCQVQWPSFWGFIKNKDCGTSQ